MKKEQRTLCNAHIQLQGAYENGLIAYHMSYINPVSSQVYEDTMLKLLKKACETLGHKLEKI